jgi:hypothetical protein
LGLVLTFLDRALKVAVHGHGKEGMAITKIVITPMINTSDDGRNVQDDRATQSGQDGEVELREVMVDKMMMMMIVLVDGEDSLTNVK